MNSAISIVIIILILVNTVGRSLTLFVLNTIIIILIIVRERDTPKW